jgi:hypothetical protein
MGDQTACQPRVRRMYPWEVEEARCVFASTLDYDQVRIHECDPFPNRIDRLGRRLKGQAPSNLPNAITLGNHCRFPVNLPQQPLTINDPEHYKIEWLIHELTHAWQYQKRGWRYLYDALSAQFKLKEAAYQYGGREALKSRRKDGWTFAKFNPEQQGDITRDYYYHFCRGEDVSDWLPYIEDLRKNT